MDTIPVTICFNMHSVVGKFEIEIDEKNVAHLQIDIQDGDVVQRLLREDFIAINLTTYHRSKF